MSRWNCCLQTSKPNARDIGLVLLVYYVKDIISRLTLGSVPNGFGCPNHARCRILYCDQTLIVEIDQIGALPDEYTSAAFPLGSIPIRLLSCKRLIFSLRVQRHLPCQC